MKNAPGIAPTRAITPLSTRFALLLILSFAFPFFIAPYSTAESISSIFVDDPALPWEIKAESLEYDPETETYIATDGVTISKAGRTVSADRVIFDYKNMTAVAIGNVTMTAGEDVVTAERVEIDLKDETGVMNESAFFFTERHFYIKGERITKVGEDRYKAYKASLTSCDADPPAWKITGQNLDITIEGYGTLQHGALWVKDVPVLYVPFFIFPVKQERQSGLLIPDFASSDRRGFEYGQPFFWAISGNTDATFNNRYMSKRGNRLGVEYRYALDIGSKGTVMFDYLDDDKIDDGGSSSREYGFTGDEFTRPNHDRYWFRMKADQSLDDGFTARLDLDVVSDQDYLFEFKEGHFGFNRTKSYFNGAFGRDLEEYDDPIRANRIALTRLWPRFSFNAEMLWYDNVISRRWLDEDTTLHRLPYVTFTGVRQPILNTPYFWNLESEYTYFYSKDGDRSHRGDLFPRVFRPERLGRHFYLEPSFGIRQTFWYAEQNEDGNPDGSDGLHYRLLPDAGVDLYTRLFRNYDLAESRNDFLKRYDLWPNRIRHILRPQLTYRYIPDVDQSDLPALDALDRIEGRNRITTSLVQTVISPDRGISGRPPRDGEAIASPQFHRILRFELSQSFDFNEYDPDPATLELRAFDETTPEIGEHYSPLYARLDLTPSRYLNFMAETEWSHRSTRFITRNFGISTQNRSGDSLLVEYRYTRDLTESLLSEVNVNLSRVRPGLSAFGNYERNLRDNTDIEIGFGLGYTSQCWSMRIGYSKEADDRSVSFLVRLHGLGALGTSN